MTRARGEFRAAGSGGIPTELQGSACGKVPAPLRSVNRFVSSAQQLSGYDVLRFTQRRHRDQKCALLARFSTRQLTVDRLYEVPQLDGRKFTEAFLDLALGTLEENPARRAPSLPVHEVHAPAHRADLGVRLHLDEHLPALVAALQLAHVLRAFRSRKWGAHAATLCAPTGIP